eukprot:gnl/TRDRNA2_/TRDRNA2_93529_c0_seq1.p1 gnl/TRDRNA2_/TRDRNA2_93529_c0~~gnl/TRDRNA2_/TRDRNA2_93529_c0_seq1.p1  ORF type:complete len:234 (+),score=28.10 gnl/TRDRNA2_/TRDRNA2_93529_c0_seq1:140-841(+)
MELKVLRTACQKRKPMAKKVSVGSAVEAYTKLARTASGDLAALIDKSAGASGSSGKAAKNDSPAKPAPPADVPPLSRFGAGGKTEAALSSTVTSLASSRKSSSPRQPNKPPPVGVRKKPSSVSSPDLSIDVLGLFSDNTRLFSPKPPVMKIPSFEASPPRAEPPKFRRFRPVMLSDIAALSDDPLSLTLKSPRPPPSGKIAPPPLEASVILGRVLSKPARMKEVENSKFTRTV